VGGARRIGRALVAETTKLFHVWHRYRDGTIEFSTLQRKMVPIRRKVMSLLCEGSRCRHSKTAGRCREILKLAPALWTFTRVMFVEPTNNFAERQIRPGVLWRKGSFGTHSEEGSRFVERMMTTAATLKQQGRNVLDYVAAACEASLCGREAPSLLPDFIVADRRMRA
jgi:transposase